MTSSSEPPDLEPPDLEPCVVLCTVPDMNCAEVIARALLDEQLAACINVLPGVRSFYLWKGKLADDSELQLLIKTRAALLPELEAKLEALHPYEVSEFLALPTCAGSRRYLKWMAEHTNGPA